MRETGKEGGCRWLGGGGVNTLGARGMGVHFKQKNV